ncbi:DUF1330 domain-containing protein [Halioxenophilus aromaticivorans]|uniref:DUF1330 domain-containing protein n=1 Tax=Halioxenophilus aromaticivorans TaxID=1306992 RepID=A0AAV3U9U5_9ALTE
MPSVEATPEALEQLIKKIPSDQPFYMVNLVAYNAVAQYQDNQDQDNDTNITGQEAYSIYSNEAVKLVEKAGGQVIWFGEVIHGVIQPSDENWDNIFIVQYPSVERFMAMITSPEYLSIVQHRTAALADSRLIATLGAPGAN